MAKTKKEFSKEAMYKKIMPSMFRVNDDSHKSESKTNNDSDENKGLDVDNSSLSKLFTKVEKIDLEDNLENDDIQNINDYTEAKEEKQVIQEIKKVQDIQEIQGIKEVNECKEEHLNDKINNLDYRYTVNFIEVLIKDKLDAVLERFKCCQCESCLNDIVEIALNSFPNYSFTGTKKEIEEAFIEFKKSSSIDVISAIIKAIILIRKKEKHNKN